MGLFKNQDRDPASGQAKRQPVAGKSPDACPICDYKHPPRKCRRGKDNGEKSKPSKCEACGKLARMGKTLCRPCESMQTKSDKSQEKAAKRQSTTPKGNAANSKKAKRGFGWSEVSTIHVKGVAKNKWRRTYNGPPVRPENYLKDNDG